MSWQSWQKNADDTFLFPTDWYAAVCIVNQRDEDLINPHLTISFEEHSYAVDKPTIRAGQYLDLKIPLANECASRLEGYCDLDIAIDFKNYDILPYKATDERPHISFASVETNPSIMSIMS